jgi:hypothetical protein
VFEKPDEWEDLIKQGRAQLSDIQDKIGRSSSTGLRSIRCTQTVSGTF